jgi:hypothetical protein
LAVIGEIGFAERPKGEAELVDTAIVRLEIGLPPSILVMSTVSPRVKSNTRTLGD